MVPVYWILMETAAITALINIVSKTMDMLPDYDQKKRKQWHKLLLDFNDEKKKAIADRDDDLFMNLREQVILFGTTYADEIKGK